MKFPFTLRSFCCYLSISMVFTFPHFLCFVLTYCVTSLAQEFHHCSRAESRMAMSILEEVVYPLYDFSRISIPDACPWNPLLDRYRLQERMKFQNSPRDWECRQCGKRFYSEDKLDLHMDNRHSSMLYVSENSTCLAALCPLLRCGILHPDLAFGDQVFWEAALCEESQFASLRKQCENMLEQCGAGIQDGHPDLRNWLRITLCDHLTCAKHWDVPDHRVSSPFGLRVLLVILAVIGLIVYYVVLLIRISSSPNSLPASSLSSPYYFQSLSSIDTQTADERYSPKVKRHRIVNR